MYEVHIKGTQTHVWFADQYSAEAYAKAADIGLGYTIRAHFA